MAVVVAPEHVDEFMKYAAEENLEATIVAVATDTKRLVMHWRDQNVVNITRAFLDTNGVTQHRKAVVSLRKIKISSKRRKSKTSPRPGSIRWVP